MAKIDITTAKNVIESNPRKAYFKIKNTGGPKGADGAPGATGATGPQGPQGPQGRAATVTVGSTTTLGPGSNATVTNSGNQYDAVLEFGIPTGPQGPTGATGAQGPRGFQGERGVKGDTGAAATITLGSVSTGAAGSNASIVNTGDDHNAVYNFTIPRGAKGDTGTSPTVAVYGTTTLPAGSQATVTNVGTSQDVQLQFSIPQGEAGKNTKLYSSTGQNTDGAMTQKATTDALAPKIQTEVVAELPATGDEGKLYLTPKDYTTGTASGNPITITLGEDAGQITSFKLDGDTYQQSYTGKNLYDASLAEKGNILSNGSIDSSEKYVHSVLIPVTPSTSYTASAVFDGTEQDNFIRMAFYDSQQSFISRTSTSGVNTTTSPATASYFRIAVTITATSVMLEKSATATTYEPYVGGQASPNPDYPQQIQTVTGEQTVEVVGINLLGSSWESGGLDGATGAKIPYSNTVRTADFVKVEPNKTYILSRGGAGVAMNVFRYGSDKSFLYSSTISAGNVFTTNEQTQYVMFFRSATGGTEQMQLQKGSTITPYTPYSKQTLPISLGSIELCKLGTYQDYIYKDGDSWKVHKATELWPITNNSSAKGYTWEYSRRRIYLNPNAGDGLVFSAKVAAVADNNTVFPACANKFVAKSFNNIITDGINGFCLSQSKAMSFRNNAWSDETTARSQLDGTNVIYPLATPTDTTITDTTLIAQLEAVRNASLQASDTIANTAAGTNLAGDLELGYCEYNPTNRYDKWLWLDLNNNYEKLGN